MANGKSQLSEESQECCGLHWAKTPGIHHSKYAVECERQYSSCLPGVDFLRGHDQANRELSFSGTSFQIAFIKSNVYGSCSPHGSRAGWGLHSLWFLESCPAHLQLKKSHKSCISAMSPKCVYKFDCGIKTYLWQWKVNMREACKQ